MVNGSAVKTMAFSAHSQEVCHELLQASCSWFQFYREEETVSLNLAYFQHHASCLLVVKGTGR